MNEGHLRNLEDMLATYNRMTELCFTKCISNMNSDRLTSVEADCVSSCSSKSINGSHRIMSTFMEVQSRKQETLRLEGERMAKEEMEKQAIENTKLESTDNTPEESSIELPNDSPNESPIESANETTAIE